MGNFADLTNKRIVVTGASTGIGQAAAVLISELGGKIIAVGRNEDTLQQTLDRLTGNGHRSAVFDLADVEQIPKWMPEIADGERLDGLVHMAGILESRPLRVSDASFVDNLLSINVGSALQLARGFRNKKVRAATSSIVFASSIAALIGESGISAYSATKGAIVSLSRSLASELAGEGIRVNCVSPSLVKTEMGEKILSNMTEEQITAIERQHPLGFGEPVDVASLIAFLVSDASRWITGSNIVIDGGYSTK